MQAANQEGKPEKLAEAAYRQVLNDILNCVLPGGTIIQERKLAQALEISRSPMRDALNRLEGEGLLVRLTDRLLAVRVITLEDYLHTLDVRALIEPQAASLATPNVEASEIQHLMTMYDEIEASTAPTPEMHWAFDDLLHGTLAQRSGNEFLARTIEEMRRYTKIFERQTIPVRINPGAADHQKVLFALKSGQAEDVKQAMAQHIRNIRKRTLAGF